MSTNDLGLFEAPDRTVLSSSVVIDDVTAGCASAFDYPFDGESSFTVPSITPPNDFAIGLIVGPSGSGKSSALSQFGTTAFVEWVRGRSICSHFGSVDNAVKRLGATGLNSIPAWVKPYHVLSTGERFRADLARRLRDGAVIDEFTSVVDRDVAKSCAFAAGRFIRQEGLSRIVFATCHYDVAEWLRPDWVFDTGNGTMSLTRGSERPVVTIELSPIGCGVWAAFRDHHYLSADINKSAQCWLARWDGVVVGFASMLAFPNGNWKNGWREHRTVVLPEYQGLGIGVRLSDALGEIALARGGRFFSKTSSFRMGGYRNGSSAWRPTSKNGRDRKDYLQPGVVGTKGAKTAPIHAGRVCFSHEYAGMGRTP